MILISHRRNTIYELQSTPLEYGVEVDVRSSNGELIISHDPFVDGDNFEDWLEQYSHQMLVLNVKEEGLEDRLIKLMRKYNIEEYFFLDQSFPYLLRYAGECKGNSAVRISEFESIQTALLLSGRVKWVWVDSFSRFPLLGEEAKALQKSGFKLCLVSPELHGQSAEFGIDDLATILQDRGISPDAICTKFPSIWNQMTIFRA